MIWLDQIDINLTREWVRWREIVEAQTKHSKLEQSKWNVNLIMEIDLVDWKIGINDEAGEWKENGEFQ